MTSVSFPRPPGLLLALMARGISFRDSARGSVGEPRSRRLRSRLSAHVVASTRSTPRRHPPRPAFPRPHDHGRILPLVLRLESRHFRTTPRATRPLPPPHRPCRSQGKLGREPVHRARGSAAQLGRSITRDETHRRSTVAPTKTWANHGSIHPWDVQPPPASAAAARVRALHSCLKELRAAIAGPTGVEPLPSAQRGGRPVCPRTVISLVRFMSIPLPGSGPRRSSARSAG